MTTHVTVTSDKSTAYFILHRDKEGYSELGVNPDGDLFIRRTFEGLVLAQIPLGKCTQENIEILTQRMEDLSFFFEPD